MGTILQEYDAKLMFESGPLIGLDEVGRGALAGSCFYGSLFIKRRLFLNLKKSKYYD